MLSNFKSVGQRTLTWFSTEEAFPFVSANPIFNENSIQIQYLIKTNIRKAAEKGGTVVVWRADLYQKEVLRQLSDALIMPKLTKISLSSTKERQKHD